METSFFILFCDTQLSRDIVLRSSRRALSGGGETVYNGGEIQGGFADEI